MEYEDTDAPVLL